MVNPFKWIWNWMNGEEQKAKKEVEVVVTEVEKVADKVETAVKGEVLSVEKKIEDDLPTIVSTFSTTLARIEARIAQLVQTAAAEEAAIAAALARKAAAEAEIAAAQQTRTAVAALVPPPPAPPIPTTPATPVAQ